MVNCKIVNTLIVNTLNSKFFLLLILFLPQLLFSADTHPGLFLTPRGVKEIRKSAGKFPVFNQSYTEMKQIADNALKSDITVPIPVDAGGGYTHEKHKNIYYEMNAAGIVYQISGDVRYAAFVKNMLYKYAEMYPKLDLHPVMRSKTRGKIFWQALNEAVWLVHTAMAYDCVYNYISETDRKFIEQNLFYPMAEFLSNGNKANYDVFNMMHNHGTWATAAVGMIGYAMGDKNLVEKALYGSAKDGKTGFIRQLDFLFSPDGYFTEGPYYQRYAIWPFMTFAQVIQNRQPELNIFAYRDSILLKAVDILLQSSYNGEIFYLNDALSKTFKTQEIVYAVNIAYKNNPKNKSLLTIANQQQQFVISDAGIETAKAMYRQKTLPAFSYRSLLMHDGLDGTQGGIAIFRSGQSDKDACMTFKATSHGLSHGHYDKLSITLHDNGNPILADYGAVRFLNIEPKYGGHYTPENYSWAMQTIAHNTVSVDSTSHYKADINISSEYNPKILFADYQHPEFQIVSAVESNAYPGIKLHRTTGMLNNKQFFTFPVLIDVFRVEGGSQTHTFDLPFYYKGHFVSANFEYKKQTTTMKPLGTKNGYQHLWVEAYGKTDKPFSTFTWFNGNRFYSINTLTNDGTEMFMVRTGASDPFFNLRYEPAFILRQNGISKHTFVSVIEPHGLYDISKEVTEGFSSSVTDLKLIYDDADFTAVEIHLKNEKKLLYIQVNQDFDTEKQRSFNKAGKNIQFRGNYYINKL